MRAALLGSSILFSALAACSVRPDGSNGLRREFTLQGIDHAQAYHRSMDFARSCHTGGGILKHATVTGEIYPDTRSAEVHVAWGGSTMAEQITVTQIASDSRVVVAALGHGMWDERELDAAQRSIESGTPTCR
ncbi:MAG: hypothetical protein ABFC67_04780 [Mizugakiibacter sp.]|uniref:BPTD_2524 family lipoprotein n=1 Tax=Mizugakiibacter sp. TaxID=1972610 RepID=UPI00320E7FC4